MIDRNKLLDKAECITLLCTKACSHWNYIKLMFNIPLIFTSSAMCIINSISTNANTVKIPNIVVNAVSVLIISLNNSFKASERVEIFKKLSQQFLSLSHDIEALDYDDSDYKNKLLILDHKYNDLLININFEDIPFNIKNNISSLFNDHGRYIPIQLNGTCGLMKRRSSEKLNIDLGNLGENV